MTVPMNSRTNREVSEIIDAVIAERAALRAENEQFREALQLADAALRGANMNMPHVQRKVEAALGGKMVAARRPKLRRGISWSPWFLTKVRYTKFVEREPFSTSCIPLYVSGAKWVLLRFDKAKAESRVVANASWLNAEAIAYRRGIGRPTINGFFIA
jgi:hypothetical protein